MRRANAAILRERHIMPTIEDFLPRFTSAKYFSRLDIEEAFHQVELKEESRYITTFITHKGLFQYKRLMYGIVIAPELFQRIMEQILSRCENTVNFIDDILVFGSTENEHDKALKLVLSVLNEHGILLNQEKCLFKVNSLDFLGHTISPDGSSNVADPLSRLSVNPTPETFDPENKFMVLAVMESAAIDVQELENTTNSDAILGIVKQCLRSGNWDKDEAKPFLPFKHELGFVGDMLVRGNKLVVPTALKMGMLDIAHEGHPGESVMKRRLRDRVWWPGMDNDAVSRVKACEGCRLVGLPSRPEPMSRRPLPSGPWIDIAMDFLGPLPCGSYLLVIIDYYSRYKEVEIMFKITARDTISRLDRIFTRLGYPRTITLDNAKQFVSTDLDSYSKLHGITLNHSTPYWPQENGLVERQNRSLVKRLQISAALGRDWKKDLHDYLIMYYTTPHSITGKTPTELMYGHTIRSKLPAIEDIETTPPNADFRDRDKLLKEKGKEVEDTRRRATRSSIDSGDTVLMQNLLPSSKLSTTFNPKQYTVLSRSGPRVTVEDYQTLKSYDRNVVMELEGSSTGAPGDSSENQENQKQLRASSEEDFHGFELEDDNTARRPIAQYRTVKKPVWINNYLQ
ncbi:uncharacterized protein K02A2.6-like [Armigeres subalbatus]|uniref:uncharacterized protein K02A2.6-like n=1 Tax=Armigeres subalbatus TaxID=124917 RepID=UPI002ED6889A